MVLSDRTIRRLLAEGRIGIDPYDEALLQPSSVDVRVDRFFRVFHNARYPFIDVKQPQEELTELVEIDGDRPFILHPGEFVLGSTLERVTLPDDLVARLEGKCSLGRLGLLIHSTAGFIDPGWDGHVTLELSNVANLPITIYFGMKIGQLSFVQLTEAGRDAVRLRQARLEVPGPAGPDAEPVLAELRPLAKPRADHLEPRRDRRGGGVPHPPAPVRADGCGAVDPHRDGVERVARAERGPAGGAAVQDAVAARRYQVGVGRDLRVQPGALHVRGKQNRDAIAAARRRHGRGRRCSRS